MNRLERNLVVTIGLLILGAALYLPRVNRDWYYLYGEEATGLTLVMALGSGQGYSDISLPGAPPHVREPFLFYFLESLIYRGFGMNLWLMKSLVALSALLAGPLAFLLFRRLASPRIALLAALLTLAAPAVVDYAALFRPDPFANTLYLAALLGLEKYQAEKRAFSRVSLGAALLLLAAYLVRSTALAVALAWPLALALERAPCTRFSLNLKKALIILIPFALGFGLWEYRNQAAALRSGLTYSGRYLIGAPPDSLTIMAEDFHAPLHPPWPQATTSDLANRISSQLWYYGNQTFHFFFNLNPGQPGRSWLWPLALILFALVLVGWWSSAWNQRSITALCLPIYLLAIAAWPMRAPRQTFLLLPFLFFYCLLGLELALVRSRSRLPRLSASALGTAAALLLLANFIHGDLLIFRQAQRIRNLPSLEISPGFSARILSSGRQDSAQVLLWARDHLPRDATLMFHSPPPCYLITHRQCSSIPFESDPKKVRDYLKQSPVAYVILDGWERENPNGPAQFVSRFLEPALLAFPQDFEPVLQDQPPGTAIYRVKKTF